MAEPTKYTQNWRVYNTVQTTEKISFLKLLGELCQGIDEPEQMRGRPRIKKADLAFAAIYKVYCTLSGRRFMPDLQSACSAGHIERPAYFSTLYNFFENAAFTPMLYELLRESAAPLRAVETSFAIDSSGFSTGNYSIWHKTKHRKTDDWRNWVTAHVVCAVRSHIIVAAEVGDKHTHDSKFFETLVKQAVKNGFTIKQLAGDKAYLSAANLELIDRLGGAAFIEFKSNSKGGNASAVWNRMFHFFSFNRELFDRYYHQRSNVETTFAMVKAKFSEQIRSKTPVAQTNELLCKLVAHNICCLIQLIHENGLEPVFWEPEEPRQLCFVF